MSDEQQQELDVNADATPERDTSDVFPAALSLFHLVSNKFTSGNIILMSVVADGIRQISAAAIDSPISKPTAGRLFGMASSCGCFVTFHRRQLC